MPQTHHSHSGSFCCHAKDTLPLMVSRAISLHYTTLCLTEHVPRDTASDLYPEEVAASLTPFDLFQRFDQYVHKAREMRKLVKAGWTGAVDEKGEAIAEFRKSESGLPEMEVLIGMETEYIRPSSLSMALELREKYALELLIGSVHHVNTIPIDFDQATFQRAVESCSPPTETGLFEAYFDHHFEVLSKLKPEVVGHWDLIRLFCADFKKDLKDYGGQVWEKCVRNAEEVAKYGGLVEVNSSAVRKGWDGPYPRPDVMKLLISKGARFCLSDDSHSTEQMGLNYHVVIPYLESLGVERVHYLEKLPMGQVAVDMLGGLKVSSVKVSDLRKSMFWQAIGQVLPAASSS
ncbi:histidinol phosphate phosphatase H [Ascobolus immersus RN42]|uniref:Histidinol-phosphatase n=1 Tax=Ascobolus immersus RN42 TaxID=1160509 RepID=A0A3N4J1S6_ASCIM|nr:histidinol phosphate phosphatase H [Ascobolus immersus RN42]